MAAIAANALQPYLTQSQVLIPTQLYLLGAVALMAYARPGMRWQTVRPLVLVVWPLTVLGWLPIAAPVLYVVGTGLVSRSTQFFSEAPSWGINVEMITHHLGGYLVPATKSMGVLLGKVGLRDFAEAPNTWLFASFLFVPGLLVLWRSGSRHLRIPAAGVLFYVASVLLADLVSTPVELVNTLGFWRLFAFPVVSALTIAVAVDAVRSPAGMPRFLRWFQWAFALSLAGMVILWVAFAVVSDDAWFRLADRLGLINTGKYIPFAIREMPVYMRGMAIGLAALLLAATTRWRVPPMARGALLALAIIMPVMTVGNTLGWNERPKELDAMLEAPAEIGYVRSRVPSFEYRVGIVKAAAEGQLPNREPLESLDPESSLYLEELRQNDVRLRYGLAYALPRLHFYSPVHVELREAANWSLAAADEETQKEIAHRSIIVDPDVPALEAYGVRYWITDYDLDRVYGSQFDRLFEGEFATVYENRVALPIAYFEEVPGDAVALENRWTGFTAEVPDADSGALSLSVDLRRFDASAVDEAGDSQPLEMREADGRWLVDVPAGTTRVAFHASEFGLYVWLSAAAAVLFAIGVTMAAWWKRLRLV